MYIYMYIYMYICMYVYFKEMYIIIDRRCLFDPFSYVLWSISLQVNLVWIWYVTTHAFSSIFWQKGESVFLILGGGTQKEETISKIWSSVLIELKQIVKSDAIYLVLQWRCRLNLFQSKNLMGYQFFFVVRYFFFLYCHQFFLLPILVEPVGRFEMNLYPKQEKSFLSFAFKEIQ